jgi:hypothetical protein
MNRKLYFVSYITGMDTVSEFGHSTRKFESIAAMKSAGITQALEIFLHVTITGNDTTIWAPIRTL